MKNTIIRQYDPHFKAHIQYGYGFDRQAKKRAWVTYISYHWDDLFPHSSKLTELREGVKQFCEANNLKIEMEQCTDLRFNFMLNEHDHTNCNINDEGQIYKNNTFYSSAIKYRSYDI